ncbi:unnamed protein product [Dibothriocephalus latus]|uniref:Uncharacterized protein n=1 Tax=Dibothriocephalus latus TaxID=60516 RepID=A0A3P7P903_DIBLA|nr:unnamed protein product [Dibothriocephalus latus]
MYIHGSLIYCNADTAKKICKPIPNFPINATSNSNSNNATIANRASPDPSYTHRNRTFTSNTDLVDPLRI